MNRKLFGLLVPVMGFAVLVGSGFASWHFHDSYTNEDGKLTGSITLAKSETATIGTIADDLTFTVNLDQLDSGVEYTEENISNPQQGITVTMAQPEFTINPQYFESRKASDASIVGYSNITLQYTYSFVSEECGDLLTYLEFDGTITGNLTFKADGVYTIPTFDLKYKAKPLTQADYNTMKAAIEGDKLAVKVTVTDGTDEVAIG